MCVCVPLHLQTNMKRGNLGFASDNAPPKRRRIVDGRIVEMEQGDMLTDRFRPPLPAPSAQPPGLHGGVSLADAVILPKEVQNATAHTGVIVSAGRGDPNTKQSRVQETMVAAPGLYELRSSTLPGREIVPVGPRECFNILGGMPLFEATRENDANVVAPREGFQGFGERHVFGTVNGMDIGAEFHFAGISSTTTEVGTNPGADPALAVTTAGGETMINMGPCTIKNGQKVGYLQTPFALRNDDGRLVPGVSVPGYNAQTFTPMIVPFDDISSDEVVTRCVEVAKQHTILPTTTPAEFHEIWTRARQQVRQVVFNNDFKGASRGSMMADVMWLDIYLGWQLLFGRQTNVTRGTLFSIVEKAQVDRANQLIRNNSMMPKATPVDPGPLSGDEMIGHATWRQAQCIINHRNWVDSRLIGKAMKTAGPGGALDILLGYVN